MIHTFESKIGQYAPGNALEQENVIKELLQQCILASLSHAGFFQEAIFHGGTCLKMFHGLARFSEDLDFLLKASNFNYSWDPYLAAIARDMDALGIRSEIADRSSADDAVKKAFLKTDSIGNIIDFDLPFMQDQRKRMRVKLEVDANPPAGSAVETHFLTFPAAAAITTQPLPHAFGLKLHALLCRSYDKGRDWYDFAWYVSRRIVPDRTMLANAMIQSGPWQDSTDLSCDSKWIETQLKSRIDRLDWNAVRRDVERFIPAHEQRSLATWGKEYFYYQVDQMIGYLRGDRANLRG